MSSFTYAALVCVGAAALLIGGPQLVVALNMAPLEAYFAAIAATAVLVRVATYIEENT